MAHVDPRTLDEFAATGRARRRDVVHLDGCVTCRRAAVQRGIPSTAITDARRFATRSRRRAVVGATAVAASAALIFIAAPIRSVAAGFFTFFEPRAVAAIPLTLDDMRSLDRIADLSAYASTRELRKSNAATFLNARAAGAAAGFTLRSPTNVPAGIEPLSYLVSGPSAQLLTFGRTRSTAAVAPLPADIVGSTLRVDLGATVVATYESAATRADQERLQHALQRLAPSGSRQLPQMRALQPAVPQGALSPPGLTTRVVYGRPVRPAADPVARDPRIIQFTYTGHVTVVHNDGRGTLNQSVRSGELPLVVVQMPAPRIATTGVSLARLASFMLGRPGVPPRVVAAFRALGDLSTTLPIPVPIDKAYTQPVFVDGVVGVGIGDDTGIGAAVIWQKNGMLYAVFAPRTARDVLAIANSLA